MSNYLTYCLLISVQGLKSHGIKITIYFSGILGRSVSLSPTKVKEEVACLLATTMNFMNFNETIRQC